MNSSIKQIYVALQISGDAINIIAAEYFNTRFNVLKTLTRKTKAIVDFKVVDKELLSQEIKELVDDLNIALASTIEKFILVVPAYNFKRYSLRSSVIPTSQLINKKDIARAISNCLKTQVDKDVLVINALINKYIVNGIQTRKMPENEACNEFYVDVDLLCGDYNLLIDYLSCIENAGYEVLDICLNTYGIIKEASLLEESLKHNIVVLDIENSCSYISLLAKGRLASSEIIYDGLDNLVNNLRLKLNLNDEELIKLIKYTCKLDNDNDDIVYAYNEQFSNKTISISQSQLNDLVLPSLNNLVDKLLLMSNEVIGEDGQIFITGQGADINTLQACFENKTTALVQTYYPHSFGVRDPSLTSLYGALFVYRDKVLLNDLNVDCLDLLKYEESINGKSFETEGATITTKIKNLFKQYIEGKSE